jgi:hypothetical protein
MFWSLVQGLAFTYDSCKFDTIYHNYLSASQNTGDDMKQLRKIYASYATPLLLLIIISAANSPSVGALPANTTYEGTIGLTPSAVCLDPHCNNANGCSWLVNTYDYWYTGYDCHHSNVPGAGACVTHWALCHKLLAYVPWVGNCSGSYTTYLTYQGDCT